ncbi:sialin-like protein 7 [Leptotrombidium deliense]|uniref:Sialin-like protein 7 n=1 Tax=Leptotrombidium deliense TaxID=299467 RepID=A0A443SVU7_9ACAR|nr:sialin-like protein 7 [Leptotrombidium deliense]
MLCIGYISDKIESKRLLNRTYSRKLFEVCSELGTGAALCLVPFASSVPLIVCLLVTSMAFNGFYAGGTNPIIVDIAPDYSGTIYGLASTVASSTGFIAPLFVGIHCILPPQTMSAAFPKYK